MLNFCAIVFMYTCSKRNIHVYIASRHVVIRVVASKSRLFRLRAKIGCPNILIISNCSVIICTIKQNKKLHRFLAHTNLPYRKKTNKKAFLVSREILTELLYATRIAPNPTMLSNCYLYQIT